MNPDNLLQPRIPAGVLLLLLLCLLFYFFRVILPISLAAEIQTGLVFFPALYDFEVIAPYYYISALTRFLTYSLVHFDFLHLFLNMLFLLSFGTIINRRIGSVRFLILCCIGSFFGGLFHLLWSGYSGGILLGASAMVSACMGAASRFCFQDGYSNNNIHLVPLLRLGALMQNSRTKSFILVWLGINLLFGILPSYYGDNIAIAWQSHIGGFLSGLLSMSFLDSTSLERKS